MLTLPVRTATVPTAGNDDDLPAEFGPIELSLTRRLSFAGDGYTAAVSYDVNVYGGELDAAGLRALVAASPGLEVQEEGSADDHLLVVRGASRRYSFTIDGPLAIEAEDVPEELAGVLLGPSTMFQVLVEGTTASEIPHAVRFAKRLAKAIGGAAHDLQTDEVHGGAKRVPPRVAGGEKVELVEFCWRYLASEITPDEVARQYLRVARQHLPEALPRRFGGYEPLQGKLDEVGDDGFANAVITEDMSLFFSTSRPVRDGHLTGGWVPPSEKEFRNINLRIEREALRDPGWRRAVRSFFLELAAAVGAVYAAAEVVEGFPQSPIGPHWDGLPARAPWWSLIPPPYHELIRAHVPAELVTPVGDALLVAWSEEPTAPEASDGGWLPAAHRYERGWLTFADGGVTGGLRPARELPAAYLSEHRLRARQARANRGTRILPPPPIDWGDYTPPADDRSTWPELRQPSAEKAFAAWVADGPARHEALRSLLARGGVELTATDAGLQALNDWLFRHLEADTGDPARPAPRWADVMHDIGRFVGDTIIGRAPAMHWALSDARKNRTGYRQVLLAGTPEPWGNNPNPQSGFLESVALTADQILAGDLDPARRENQMTYWGARSLAYQVEHHAFRGTPGRTRADWYAWNTMRQDIGR